jgi:hypothetical protein
VTGLFDEANAGDAAQRLRNLTPHPLHVYRMTDPDVLDPDEVEPWLVLQPDVEAAARVGMVDLGEQSLGVGIPVAYVEFGRLARRLPDRVEGQWLVVSLPVVLVATYADGGRDDLLVPYLEVRNPRGTVVGCRMLARPV